MREAIAVAVQQHAFRRLAVAARPARLLVVRLKRPGHLEVDDAAHVGLVDPHAERVGRHHDRHATSGPRLLHPRALRRLHPAVIGSGFHPRRAQIFGGRLHHLARGGVDDRRAVTATEQADESSALLGQPLLAPDAPAQVRPVEATDNDAGSPEPQLLDDVTPHFGRRRGREREQARPAQLGPDVP